ncbi:MAG: SH3 domain-containing protein [Microcoleaceae cyanobacterium]
MKFKNIVLSLASFVTISIGYVLPGFATPVGETAQLFTYDTGSEVNIRIAPTTLSESPHYGFNGDPVVVISEIEGKDGYYWYYVRFEKSEAEGWVRGDFISFDM